MTREKREPPLALEMDFGEALERFLHTDQEEVRESIDRAKQKKTPGDKAPRHPPRKRGQSK